MKHVSKAWMCLLNAIAQCNYAISINAGQYVCSTNSVHVWLSLQWRHNERDGVSNHQLHDSLLNRLLGCRSKKTSKFCVTGPCAGISPGTGEFPAQRASNAANVSIWWRHHAGTSSCVFQTIYWTYAVTHHTGLILGLRPASERRCYFVAMSLIGW